MVERGLGESAIRSYTNVVKMVVASAVNEEGEELYPRKWNHSFIDLPRTRNPKQPSFAGAVVTRIITDAKKEKYRLLFALCGGTGLRFGEALGIRIQDISPDCSTVKDVQKRGGHSFTIFSRPKAVLEKLICALRLRRC
jgi:integrase